MWLTHSAWSEDQDTWLRFWCIKGCKLHKALFVHYHFRSHYRYADMCLHALYFVQCRIGDATCNCEWWVLKFLLYLFIKTVFGNDYIYTLVGVLNTKICFAISCDFPHQFWRPSQNSILDASKIYIQWGWSLPSNPFHTGPTGQQCMMQ